MSILKQYTDAELEAELEKRKQLIIEKPKMLDNPNYERLADFAEDVVDQLLINGYVVEDIQSSAFEEMMKSFYGNDFFKWYNKVTY